MEKRLYASLLFSTDNGINYPCGMTNNTKTNVLTQQKFIRVSEGQDLRVAQLDHYGSGSLFRL